jgi:hypothetical protein
MGMSKRRAYSTLRRWSTFEPRGRELEHLLGGDPVQLARCWNDPRVGREDTVDVGVDLADARPQRGSERDGGRVRPAAPERGDLLGFLADTLEAGDDDDVPLAEGLGDPAGRDVDDLGPAVLGVGDDTGLRAGEGAHAVSLVGDGHRQQRHRNPLSGGHQHVELTRGRHRADLACEVEKFVGGVAHRGDRDDDVIAFLARVDDPARDAFDALGVGDRRATVFLDDDRQRATPVTVVRWALTL